tara:strand:- start:386 stop:775 length:390 start_codon:yes stop_codon:yes gene_type:complete
MLRINVWISFKGADKPFFSDFPYKAYSFIDKKMIEFKGMNDVQEELVKLYDKCTDKDYSIGNALFTQSKHFVDTHLLIDPESQKDITKYNFCKVSNTPLFESVNQTPYEEIQKFMIIDEEIGHIKEYDK